MERPGLGYFGAFNKCFLSNSHNLPGIRKCLFDFVLSFSMETGPLVWIIANPVLLGPVSFFNYFLDGFLVESRTTRDASLWPSLSNVCDMGFNPVIQTGFTHFS